MTIRIPVSTLENRWHDAQRVDQSDLEVEQNRNNQMDSAIIQNHFGSGVLLASPQQKVIFDSDDLDATSAALVAAGNFDGTGISPTAQPSDINLGNQLEIELTDSNVIGRLSTKVAIIGLSFDGTLQMDRLYFYRNEKQVTSKHYAQILTIFFNDFKGSTNCSRNLGGRIVIKEAFSFEMSRDPLMVSQDVEPDIFWRDFKKANLNISLFDTIQTGIGAEYSADGLQINITGRPNHLLEANDVTTQIGQKFQATTNNIQKVTLLLGALPIIGAPEANTFDWSGDLIVSIYPLQTTTNCPTDIVPELAIDFDPSSQPLAQVSFNQTTLMEAGYVLTDVLQPVDFVFNATKIGSGTTSTIKAGNFYAVTIKRSGSSTSGLIVIATGNDRTDDARATIFSGVWTDIPEEDLWFQVWTDAAKVSDGQAYDAGLGIQIDKTKQDATTGATVDNSFEKFSFSDTGANVTNIGIIQAITEDSLTVQDERTGDNVFSRQRFVPSFSFVSESGLADLKEVSEPLILGCVRDTNPKQNPLLEKTQTLPGLAKNDTFCIVNPDPDLLSLNLLGSKLSPNALSCSDSFRIFKATLCVDGYGDVNGDGYIDSSDLALATTLIGESVYSPTTQAKIRDGYIQTLELLRADVDGDGYVTADDINLLTQFINRTINSFPAGSSFTHLCLQVQQSVGRYDGYFDCNGYVRLDGYGGTNIVNPDDLSPSQLLFDGYLSAPMINLDPVFSQVPFVAVDYKITPQPFWQPYLLALASDVRYVPTSFTGANAIVPPTCTTPLTFTCEDRNDALPFADPGRNDFFVPDDLIIGKGEIRRPNGDPYKVDFEIGTIILQLPAITFAEASLNIFDKFVADRGDGFSRGGFAAQRYSDCSTVQDEDLFLNRIRFSVSIQSFYPNLDGYSDDATDGIPDGYGIIVDDIIGVHLDQSTGILKLSIKDLAVDEVLMTLVTKIQILVYLKKAGWNNRVITVLPSEVSGLLSS